LAISEETFGALDVLQTVFKAIGSLDRESLVRLRDGGDPTTWAHAHGLHSAPVIEYATALLDYWRQRPDMAMTLYCGFGGGVRILVRPDHHEARLREIRDELWAHVQLSLREWRKHADAAHRRVRELEALPHSNERAVSADTMREYADWFVLNQFRNLPASEIATSSECDLSTISKGIAVIRRRIGIRAPLEISVSR
jgi:hypothetical protein